MSLVETATSTAQKANVKHVEAVHLRLGVLSGVVKDALLFGYDIATQGTLLEGSRLEIEEVSATVYCPTCRAEQPLADIQSFRCPVCQELTPSVVQGRELEVTYLEVANDVEDNRSS